MKNNGAIIGFATAAVFSVLYFSGLLNALEDRLYDFFLGFRAERERIDNVVFLDIDDAAIAYNGIYPWPRSIPADGLLRLKEYGALAAIFDVEYIDHGPQGVDSIYLNQGLDYDFNRSFTEITGAARDILSAIRTGQIGYYDIDYYAANLTSLIAGEQRNLYARVRSIARDNDLYLAQAKALSGISWGTLNLREFPLEGEQAERLWIAEERFSYPVNASPDAHKGAGFVDVLPALPVFAKASEGAGFTNVEIDPDGVRRRVFLAQQVHDHWYLQLTFAPLIEYLGNPEIFLEKNKLTIKQAQLPGGNVKDIVIPLDDKGRMMLDWPKTDYIDSYEHISFAQFSLLDDIENEIQYYSNILSQADLMFFIQFDPSLNRIPIILSDMDECFNASHEAKIKALENTSDNYFYDYLNYRTLSFNLLKELLSLELDEKTAELAVLLAEEYPDIADIIEEEADYIGQLVNVLKINNDRRDELNEYNDKMIRGKFVIMGRVDTGTTDYGANPFYGKYINVGTHGVVLDTILSESFIRFAGLFWRILFMLFFVPLAMIVTAKLPPVYRAAAGFSIIIIVFISAILLFRFTGIFWGIFGITFSMLISVILREIISYAGSEKEKQFIRTAFSTYLSGDVVKEIISDPSRLQLGGTKREMTAIFTDVKAFSSISEKLDPEELVSLLNRYLSAMSDIILEQKGTIDKYEGDAIIAFFGAPLDLPDHALRACMSAVKIKKIETELNKEIIAKNLSPMPLLTRVGINTGFMVVGNMGTANKMNYTIMGDAVNLAARLEGVNKQYGTWILASEDTIKETGDRLLYRKLDRVRVVGKNEPVRLCELIDIIEEAPDEDKKRIEIFSEALALFEARNWKDAAEGFRQALAINSEDEPAKMYLDRCEKFLASPPAADWDGIYNLTSK